MKLVRYDNDLTGLLSGAAIIPVEAVPAGGTWTPLIDGTVPLEAIERAAAGVMPLDSVRRRAPTTGGRVFALGMNFATHVADAAAALGRDNPRAEPSAQTPAGFFVIPGSVVGPGDDISPPALAQKLDYEAEVAVVLETGGRNLHPDSIRFWGHTAWNDLSIRDPHLGLSDLDKGALSWALQKNFDGGNACGPHIVVGEGHDLDNLEIESRVNGEVRQHGSTSQMISSFADAAAYISQFVTLWPGDMLTSGTPAGTAIEQGIDGPYLKTGDVIDVTVEGVGTLRNRIVEPT
jgi:2-keto-4-pentenoate hydratase/2-oxohepta-3-ene-1,7-dioic acid hydratase in catechol pathway